MTKYNAIGLGYDLRVPPLRLVEAWNQSLRDRNLLVTEIATPLSADRKVWNSVFYFGGPNCDPADFVRVVTPSSRFIALSLWDSLQEMFVLASMNRGLAGISWPIAIKVVGTVRELNNWNNFNLCGKVAIDTADALFLGFDITNDALDTALVNMSYKNIDRVDLFERFASSLNANHLFYRYRDALAFKEVVSAFDAFDAPYYVVALYRMAFMSTSSTSACRS